MKKNFLIYIVLFISLINLSFGYLVIPFKNINSKSPQSYNLKDISGEDFLEFSTNKLVSSISIGTPYKTLELYLTMDYRLFFIGKGYCLKTAQSYYEPSISSSYNYNQKIYPNPFNDLRNMKIGKDKSTLYNDYNLKSNITIDNMQLYYGNIAEFEDNIFDKNKVCGIMGFKFHYPKNYYGDFKGFEYALKNYCNSSWTIEFFDEKQKEKNSDYDGYIILGAGDNEYLKEIKNLNSDDIEYTYNGYSIGSLEWLIKFQQIYFYYSKDNKTTMSYDFSNIAFNFDIKYYFVTKEYFDLIKESYFNKYLTKGLCKIYSVKEFYLKYKYILCDKNLFQEEKKNFPSLYFYHHSYNYTFELTYEDLFLEINNDILFLMFYDPWNPKIFKFGKNFLMKYNFIFQLDSKEVGFMNYEKNEEKKEEENEKERRQEVIEKKKKFEIIWIIVLSFLLVGIIIGIIIGKKIWDKNRKKRANELLDDNYEYKTTDDGENKDEAIIN